MAEKTVAVTQGAPAPTEGKLQTTREETRYQIPPVDIYETKDGLTVVADMPGVEKEDVDIRVDNGILTIQGKTKPMAKGDGLYNEFALLDYFRQFQLSDEVDQEKITAELKHGVLMLHMPKAEKAKPKQISVQVA
jgi:HSP20 family molecular chaperone IbpA